MGATYTKRGKAWRVTVHWQGQRERKTVRSEADAKALVQHIHKQELAGINVVEAIRAARAARVDAQATPVQYPRLRDALPTWIDQLEQAGDIRPSTAKGYRSRLASWLYEFELKSGGVLGDVPVNLVTREQIGAVVWKVKAAGRSIAIVDHIRNPLRSYFAAQIETKVLPGPNPAADLKFFIGKRLQRKKSALEFFHQEEGPQLIATAKALWPRWAPFILTGLLAGLRWGESAALRRSDIDWSAGCTFSAPGARRVCARSPARTGRIGG
jgi:integrase